MNRKSNMNPNGFASSGFAKLFSWMARAKFTMGMFFTLYVFVYLFFGLIEEVTPTLDFFIALQMIFASFFIGLFQQILLPAGKFDAPRYIVWILSGAITTLVFGFVFQWFAFFPVWCFPAFVVFLVIGMLFMILNYYLELQRETKILNRKLEQFLNHKLEKEV